MVFTFDQPWEGNSSGYATIFKDGSIYRMYYRGQDWRGFNGQSTLFTCYAESKDGINWHKPDLGLFSKKGFENNNILMEMPHTRSFFTFLDTRAGIPECEKYKSNMERNRGADRDGLNLYVSKDGK